jgi:hypothetical protein
MRSLMKTIQSILGGYIYHHYRDNLIRGGEKDVRVRAEYKASRAGIGRHPRLYLSPAYPRHPFIVNPLITLLSCL